MALITYNGMLSKSRLRFLTGEGSEGSPSVLSSSKVSGSEDQGGLCMEKPSPLGAFTCFSTVPVGVLLVFPNEEDFFRLKKLFSLCDSLRFGLVSEAETECTGGGVTTSSPLISVRDLECFESGSVSAVGKAITSPKPNSF